MSNRELCRRSATRRARTPVPPSFLLCGATYGRVFLFFPQGILFLHSFFTTRPQFAVALARAMPQSAPSACVRCSEALLEEQRQTVNRRFSRVNCRGENFGDASALSEYPGRCGLPKSLASAGPIRRLSLAANPGFAAAAKGSVPSGMRPVNATSSPLRGEKSRQNIPRADAASVAGRSRIFLARPWAPGWPRACCGPCSGIA